jgi:hypothetical protein
MNAVNRMIKASLANGTLVLALSGSSMLALLTGRILSSVEHSGFDIAAIAIVFICLWIPVGNTKDVRG